MTRPDTFFRARINSFRHALAGIGFLLRTQANARLHLAATIAICAAGWALAISAEDWRWIVLAIVLVWGSEAINTAFEHLCDVVSPQFHASVRRAKDVAAGSVLICAMGAACIGAMVFVPYLFK